MRSSNRQRRILRPRAAPGVAGAFVIAALALIGARALEPCEAEPPVIAVVATAEHELHVNGQPVAPGTGLREGDRISSVRGMAVLFIKGNRSALLRDGATVRLSEGGARVELQHGRARFEVIRKNGAPNPFRVDVGKAVVEVRGTVFAVERTWTDERVLVAVQEGEVLVTGATQAVTLRADQELTVVAGDVSAVRPVGTVSLREDRGDPNLLKRLKQRAGKLVSDWAP